MNNRFISLIKLSAVLILLSSLFIGCSRTRGPEAKLRSALVYMKAENWEEYSKCYKNTRDGKKCATDWQKILERKGGIKSFKISRIDMPDINTMASISYKINYKDGTSDKDLRAVLVPIKDGRWGILREDPVFGGYRR